MCVHGRLLKAKVDATSASYPRYLPLIVQGPQTLGLLVWKPRIRNYSGNLGRSTRGLTAGVK